MEAVHLATATARPTTPSFTSNTRRWLPAKAQLSMKNRLFSKNILRTGDIWSRGTATWKSTFVFALFVTTAFYFAYVILIRPSVGQGKPLWPLSAIFADDATIDRLGNEQESDEYEDEEESGRSPGFLANSKERLALRKMLGRSDHTLSKRSSIVRITSSDPTSSLCEHPMQVDLEPPTRRSFWPAPISHSTPSDSSTSDSPVTPSPSLAIHGHRSSSSSPGPSASRRRKESGRLHTASPSRSPLASGAALPIRPARVRPVEARSPLARTAARNKRNSTSSVSSADAASGATSSPRLAATQNSVKQGAWTDSTSALTSDAALHPDQLPDSPSVASEASSAFVALGHTSTLVDDDDDEDDDDASPSPTSSTFSLGRAPSILKRRPQTFRTASLREIDISHSLIQRKASLPFFASLASGIDPALLQQQQEALQANGHFAPFGAGSAAPPPYQPPNAQFGESPSDSEVPWSRNANKRSIKLVEPDWRPHTDSHIRARERLETAMRFAAFQASGNALGAASNSADTKFDHNDVDLDDFWFERFTQSTAAAGRDWDWRKRRARLQRAAALGMALGQSGLASQPGVNLPGNVGMTDVQLQQPTQPGGATVPAAQAASPARKQIPAAPLITFTEQELKTTPGLTIDTESGRRMMLRSGSEASLSPTVAQEDGTPMSPTPSGTGTPMGGIFGAAIPSANSINVIMAARAAQRRRASEDAGYLSHASADGSRKGAVQKITRRRLSASAAASIPGSTDPSSSNFNPSPTTNAEGIATQYVSADAASQRSSSFYRSRSSSSELDFNNDEQAGSNPPPGTSSSHSVPSRLSNLSGNVSKKVSLTNLRAGLRRSSGSGAGGNEFLSDSSGMELVPNSPDLNVDEVMGENDCSDVTPSPEGPRSSADAYSYIEPSSADRGSSSIQRAASVSRKKGSRRGAELLQDEVPARHSQPPLFRGGSSFARQASEPVASQYQHDVVEELRQDLDRDSISRGSNDSDSLRRRMRARSQTESALIDTDSALIKRGGSITARKEGLAALSAGIPSSSPPAVKSKARNGSRSSIMRSASGASSDLNRTAKRRSSMRQGSSLLSETSSVASSVTGGSSGSRNGSLRHPSSPIRQRKDSLAGAPDPHMQPEPAPRGMAQRARSASLSSNTSSLTSANSSRNTSRSNSFREAGGAAGLLGLSMTSSNPGTPGGEGERRSDPFITSMTAIAK